MCSRQQMRKWSLIIMIWMQSGLLMAQESTLFTQHKYRRLNEAQGLTNNMVNDILQDTLGQVWVATNEGLFRYQGQHFQQFIKGHGGTNLLHNNFIDNMHLDSNNTLWLMTDDGVGKYSYETDVIMQYLPGQITGRISSMAFGPDGSYYFGRYEAGILHVKNDSVTVMNLYDPVTNIDFSNLSILKMVIQDHYLWALVSDLGVIRYDLNTHQFIYFRPEEFEGTRQLQQFDMKPDDFGKIWITTEVKVYGLEVKNEQEKIIDRSLDTLIPVDDYLSIYLDSENQIWLGSRSGGVYTISRKYGEYKLLRRVERRIDESGLSSATVSKIYQEKNGNVWLGTHNGGIDVFNPNGEIVRFVTMQPTPSEYSLGFENVWGICESADKKIWVGTDGMGLSLLDPATGLVRNNVFPELDNKAVLCAHQDAKGRLWLGTYAHGVYMYDTRLQRMTRFYKGSSNADLWVNDIRCFYESENGTIYVGTNQGGLQYFDETSQKLLVVREIPDFDIRSIASTGNEILWLGTYGKGLIKYSTARNRIIPTAWNESAEHANDVIFDIHQVGDTLLVATRHHSVVAFDLTNERFLKMPELDQIGGRSVLGVESDQVGNIWMTMNTGVMCFRKSTGELKLFGGPDGFQTGHFNYGSVFRSSEGYLVLGGIHGMNLFYPDQLLTEVPKSRVVINQLKIFNTVVNPLNSNVFPDGKSIFLTDEINLDYADNIFSLQFSVPGYTSHKKDEFVYMLEGYENKWQIGAESDLATYRNVPPGNYTFRVKSLQNQAERSLKISIQPPIWKTWQAYFIYIIIITFIIWRLNRFSNSRMALRQKFEFEKELREKENAVMQEKLRFYTNFSHELKTPLTLIQGPVNDLLHATDNVKHQKYLRLIRKNTNILLRFINRMLEFRKIEMNKTTMNIGLHDLKVLAQEEAESFSYLAKKRELKFGFYCQSELEAWFDLEKIQIVMNNLLSNAFKFTPAGKQVHFGVFEKNGQIIIEVKDEGIGIKKDELKNIFSPFFQASNSYGSGGTGIGLALSKSFIELHKGTIEVESEEGKGTIFTVTIPIGKEKFDAEESVRFIDAAKTEAELFASDDTDTDELSTLKERENEKLLLIVDDNKDIAAYVESIFDAEYRVLTAENGLEAFDKAVKNTPDLIISDLMMPGMDGFQFCEKIKSNLSTSHIPVIMLTAKDSKHDKVRGYEVGVDGYVTKPFSSEVLAAMVTNLLKNREMLELHYESNDLIDPESTKSAREAEFVLQAERITLQMIENSEFSVPQLCKELGMSQSALYLKIKSLTGVSIQVFIRKIRIKRAAQLLLSEDMTVSEIAFSLEFSDLKYFRKCFKEQFGKSPSEYRQEHSTRTENAAHLE